MGIFIQEKVVAFGPKLTLLGMLLRFVIGPAALSSIGSVAAGLPPLNNNPLNLAFASNNNLC